MKESINNLPNLLNCPFCGRSAEWRLRMPATRRIPGVFSIRCSTFDEGKSFANGCDIAPETLAHETAKAAAKTWNKRFN